MLIAPYSHSRRTNAHDFYLKEERAERRHELVKLYLE